METKQDIRRMVLQKRGQLTQTERTEKSKQITDRIPYQNQYKEASIVLCYASHKSEVETDDIARISFELGKKVYYPVVTETGLQFYRIHKLEDLGCGYQGIREPIVQTECYQYNETEPPCVMILPCCGFDREGFRLGYGKGFYDYYLQQKPSIVKILLAFECQRLSNICREPHDVKMFKIMTEDMIHIRFEPPAKR